MSTTATSFFITGLLVMLLFNIGFSYANPTSVVNIIVGTVIGFIATIGALGILTGIQVLGTGISTTSQKILFGIGTLLNVLFQINIGSIPIGMGLGNSLINAFAIEDMFGIPFFLVTTYVITVLLSGIIIIIGGSD